jgi:exonuclease SbcD
LIRILHTADWHLGATLEGVNRDPDHALFLGWLAQQLETFAVDALVIAGDVFDQPQPSAEASRLYFSFLSQVALGGKVRKVVVVGGNHDSGARLDAPRELLGALDVHVVGAFERDRLERCLCPFSTGGRVEAVALAVPYVHEVRLGLRSVLEREQGLAAQLQDRFRELYRELADRAQALAPGAPIFATGHLSCLGAQRDDAPAEIHLVGSLGGLPPEIFDPRIGYVALGHIHRGYRVGESRCWYPGSPVALGLKESKTERRVLLVDLPDAGNPAGEPIVRSLAVPTFRPIVEIRGSADELADRLRALTWQAPLESPHQGTAGGAASGRPVRLESPHQGTAGGAASGRPVRLESPHQGTAGGAASGRPVRLEPFVYAILDGDRVPSGLEAQLHKAAQANPLGAPHLVQVRPYRLPRASSCEPCAPAVRLADLSPEDVFLRLCQARGVEAGDPLLRAFRSLLSPEEPGGRP